MNVKFEFALKAMDPHVSKKGLCAEYGISRDRHATNGAIHPGKVGRTDGAL